MKVRLNKHEADWLSHFVRTHAEEGDEMAKVVLHSLSKVTYVPGVCYFVYETIRMPLKTEDGLVWYCSPGEGRHLSISTIPEEEFMEWLSEAKTVHHLAVGGDRDLIWEGLG